MDETTNAAGGWRTGLRRVGKWLGILLLALILLILIVGLTPVSTDGLQSRSMPAGSYEEAVQRFEAVAQAEEGIVNDASRSILLTHGGSTAESYVLVHGITSSPFQWQQFGNVLYERGHNVLILRMPHHGLLSNNVDELRALRSEELRDYADSAVDIARGLGDEITVIGLSGGGTVTSWIGQNRPDVARIVALSPFFGVPELPPLLNTFLMNLASRAPNVNLPNPTLEQRDWRYNGEATRSAAQFARLGRSVLRAAPNDAPAVPTTHFVMTAVDETADNDYTVELAELWADAGTTVSSYEFAASYGIPHASVDPEIDPAKKALVYDKVLELLGEEPLGEGASTLSGPTGDSLN